MIFSFNDSLPGFKILQGSQQIVNNTIQFAKLLLRQNFAFKECIEIPKYNSQLPSRSKATKICSKFQTTKPTRFR